MTISKKIIGSYAVVLALLVLVTSVAFYALNQTQATYNRFLNVDERLLEAANELRSVTFAQQTYVRGMLLYTELHQVNQGLLEANDRQFKQIFERMRALTDFTESNDLVDDLETLQQQLEQAQQQAVRLALEKKTEEAIAYTIKEFRPRSIALIAKAKRFYEQQAKLLEKGRIELTEKVNSYTLTLIIAALFAIIVGLTIGTHLSRVITRELRENIAQLSSSSAEIDRKSVV